MKEKEIGGMRKAAVRYIAAFSGTVLICVLLLVTAAFVPQKRIDHHIAISVEELRKEGVYPRLHDKTVSSQLDNFTEALILIETKAMSRENLDRVFTNPTFWNYGTPMDALQDYVQDPNTESVFNYSRYWMGFRSNLRWLFAFLDYFQIRRYLAFVFLALCFGTTCSLAKHVSEKAGFLFAVSLLLVRPQLICNNLQMSCCFLIALSAMLAVPWIHRHPSFEGLFFMELGMLTMYFDFYTTPLITFGFPMVYLFLLRDAEEPGEQLRRIGKNAALWLGAYVAMWLTKLILTELFTPEPAFRDALQSISYRFGVGKTRTGSGEYSILSALNHVKNMVVADADGQRIWMIAMLCLAAVVAVKAVRREIRGSIVRENIGLLVIAVLPVLWFCATPQPTNIHYWFQYRGIVLTFWAMAAFFYQLLMKQTASGEKKRQLIEK